MGSRNETTQITEIDNSINVRDIGLSGPEFVDAIGFITDALTQSNVASVERIVAQNFTVPFQSPAGDSGSLSHGAGSVFTAGGQLSAGTPSVLDVAGGDSQNLLLFAALAVGAFLLLRRGRR